MHVAFAIFSEVWTRILQNSHLRICHYLNTASAKPLNEARVAEIDGETDTSTARSTLIA
jgi:hypothetical protein